MSTHSKVDPTTLGWVKNEIDEALKQARLALESFADNPADKTRLRFCVTHLHQVVGTLLMVELDGAAMLARETEALSEAILDDKVPANEPMLELLTRAIITLPDYLARLQTGAPDVPLRHLPLVNEMRVAHGAQPMNELDLFAPDLSVMPPPAGETRITDAEFAARARELRPRYQNALLAWLRSGSDSSPLAEIGEVLGELQAAAPQGFASQMFWAAGGLAEALANGVEASPERRKFFARIDQQIKKFMDGGERSQMRKACEELSRALLLEVAQAPASGARVVQLKRAFGLDALLGRGEAGSDLPTPEALKSVSEALGKEIEAAQDLLTAYFDPQQRDVQALDKLIEQLRKMSGILDMLGVAALKQLTDEFAETVRALQDGRITDLDAASMPMAQALLQIESSSRDFQRSAPAWQSQLEESMRALRALHSPDSAEQSGASGIEVEEAELSENDAHQLVSLVGDEIGVNLAKIEEAIEAFAADTARIEILDPVAALLSQIQGALQILGQESAGTFVQETRAHIEAIRDGALIADSAALDGLAVCVGTIGAFIDGLRAGRTQLDALLDSARREMDTALRAQSTAVPRAPAPKKPPAPVSAPAPQAAAPAPRQPSEAEAADPEIMQIFIEDARDVLNTISRVLVTFRDNPEDSNALLELRRGFHTIKGSGRMVGASDIAEFAWSIENMLNRVRDGKIKFSADMLQVVDSAHTLMPPMVGELEGGPLVSRDEVAQVRAAAEAITAGQAPGALAPVTVSASAPVTPPAMTETSTVSASGGGAEAAAQLPQLDPVLLDIFVSEAGGHLATLRKEVDGARAGGPGFVSDALFRATHTLLGNARSLGIEMMSDGCHEVEKLLQQLRTLQLPLGAQQVELVAALESAVTAIIDSLKNGDRANPALQARLAGIARQAHEANFALQKAELSPAPMPAAAVAPPPSVVPPARPPVAAPAPAPAPASRAVVPTVTSGDTLVSEQLDPELVDIFQEEAADIVGNIDTAMAQLRSAPNDHAPIHELKRALHTLKGGARMAGAMIMGTLAHNTESLLRQVEEGKIEANGAMLDMLDEAHDALVSMLDALRDQRPMPGAQGLSARILAVVAGEAMPGPAPVATAAPAPAAERAQSESSIVESAMPASASMASTPAAQSEPEPTPLAEAVPAATDTDERREGEESAAAPAWPEPMERRGQIRVNTRLLNQLVNFAGEVSISRSRMEQQIYGFRDNMAELNRNIVRFREQIRELEIQSESQILYRMDNQGESTAAGADFDPLEFDRFSRLQQLTRQLAESLHDLQTIQGNLGNFVGEAETTLQLQARLNTDLQEGLMRTRMVAFSTQAARLRHLVRTTARELGKRVELDLQGAEAELDRTVLERMVGPFEHMIRNSIDHGIEMPDVRRSRGKPAEGRIKIAVTQEGSEILVRLSDDGAGLNIEAIRNKAIERGMLRSDANLREEELVQFILQPGFSTAAKVTHVSGRGVGMDVVHSEVKQLGGSMSVDSVRGQGATFTIRLPLTLSIAQALMVFVGDQQFALPLSSVANILEYPVERLNEITAGKNPALSHGEHSYPYMQLGARLGLDSAPRNARKVPVLLARAGQRDIAIQVDGLGGTREIVIKTLGPQLAEVKGLAGATILGDGRVVLILDVAGLWFREDLLQVEHHGEQPVAELVQSAPNIEKVAKAAKHERPVIMVVDDSLTVRKITSKHLTKRGMEALTANDGLDAVEKLRDRIPDVMLVDIEMPRMDGYELTTRVRGDERLKHIPIIMITSRAGDKHRQRAFDLGVDIYMSKPYQEDVLFANIDKLLAEGHSQSA